MADNQKPANSTFTTPAERRKIISRLLPFIRAGAEDIDFEDIGQHIKPRRSARCIKKVYTVCRKLVAYAMQDELFHATLTVQEHLAFQARLRLGGQVTEKSCNARVDAVVEELGLTSWRDTLIGGWMLRGISGGEHKRLAFASEILTNPAVLFVDEPTSGLNSCMARAVVQQLKQLAAKRTVVAAIHKPSSEVFALFDRLYLLAEGATVFEGPANEAIAHFAAMGFPCPQFRNPADHFMEQLVVLERSTDHQGLARVQMLKDAWMEVQ